MTGNSEWFDQYQSRLVNYVIGVLIRMGLSGGTELIYLEAAQPNYLPLDFSLFTLEFDIGFVIGLTIFDPCAGIFSDMFLQFPFVIALCNPGISSSYDNCVDWIINYENIQLKASNECGSITYLQFKWFTFDSSESTIGWVELPKTTGKTFLIDLEASSTPTPTGIPTITPTPPPAPTGFVFISPGSFTMGSPSDEDCRYPNETQHTVTLTRGFHIMQMEVTRQMWADLKAAQPTLPGDPSNSTYSPAMNHPVQCCTWNESALFANLMSVQYGLTQCYYKDAEFMTPVDATNYTSGIIYCNFNAAGYRLPTESEWEYACRSGTTGPFSCSEPNYNSSNCFECTAGTHPDFEQYCVYCANDPGLTAVAGSKMPNPMGLYDLHGNVYEWCWDRFGTYPEGSVTDPTGPASGSYRMRRGGGWNSDAQFCRSAHRNYSSPGDRLDHLGFRLVKPVS